MPEFMMTQGAASANPDEQSLTNASGKLVQKSQENRSAQSGNFTTTSASLVDTGMSLTTSAVGGSATYKVLSYISVSNSAANSTTFSVTTAPDGYTWISTYAAAAVSQVSNGANLAVTPAAGTNFAVLLDGYKIGTGAGVAIKIQVSTAGGSTLTIYSGSILVARF